jgi:hypothetical protein
MLSRPSETCEVVRDSQAAKACVSIRPIRRLELASHVSFATRGKPEINANEPQYAAVHCRRTWFATLPPPASMRQFWHLIDAFVSIN